MNALLSGGQVFAVKDLWYWLLLMAVACYLIGCFNFAVIIARSRHKDVRRIGSGNPGTMNISREFGLGIGFVNFLCDAVKGGLPALIGFLVFRGAVFEGTQVYISDFVRYFCGFFVILGHIFPVTMRFRGGKGIASSLGLFTFCISCENPWFIFGTIGALFGVLLYIALTEWGSMGSLLGVTGFSIWQALIFFDRYTALGEISNGWVIGMFLLLFALNILPWFAHRRNLVRLFAGEEHRTSVKKLYKGKRGMKEM